MSPGSDQTEMGVAYPGKLGIIIPLFNKPTIAQATPQKYEEMPGRNVWKFLFWRCYHLNPPSCKQETDLAHMLFWRLLLSTCCRTGMLKHMVARTEPSVSLSTCWGRKTGKNHSWGHEDEKYQCPEKSKIEFLPLRFVGSFEPPISVEVWFLCKCQTMLRF